MESIDHIQEITDQSMNHEIVELFTEKLLAHVTLQALNQIREQTESQTEGRQTEETAAEWEEFDPIDQSLSEQDFLAVPGCSGVDTRQLQHQPQNSIDHLEKEGRITRQKLKLLENRCTGDLKQTIQEKPGKDQSVNQSQLTTVIEKETNQEYWGNTGLTPTYDQVEKLSLNTVFDRQYHARRNIEARLKANRLPELKDFIWVSFISFLTFFYYFYYINYYYF